MHCQLKSPPWRLDVLLRHFQLFACCPAAEDSDTEGEAGGAAAVFQRAFVAVSDMVERLVDD